MNNIFIPGDDTTKNILNNFRQKEKTERIFCKIEGNKIYAASQENLIRNKKIKLSKEIYYKANNFPFLSRWDIKLGTAWVNWFHPNFNTIFEYNGNNIEMKRYSHEKISLDDYVLYLKDKIQKNMEKIFELGYKKIYLAYSGGADSLVLLSYIIKNNWQDKIKILNFYNTISSQTPKDLSFEEKLGLKIDQFGIGIEQLLSAINENKWYNNICYATHYLSKRCSDGIIISGIHGNSVLLHKKIYVEHINKNIVKKGYESFLDGWKQEKFPKNKLEDDLLDIKPWHEFHNVFSPFYDVEMMEFPRKVDWSEVDPHVISDAQVCRKIIKENVGDLFDQRLFHNSHNDLDCIVGDLKLPMHSINEQVYLLKDDFRHDTYGYDWINFMIDKAKKEKVIDFNTIISTTCINFLLQ